MEKHSSNEKGLPMQDKKNLLWIYNNEEKTIREKEVENAIKKIKTGKQREEIPITGRQRQENKDRKKKTGTQGQENKDRKTKTGKQRQENKDRKTKTEKLKQKKT